MPTFLSSQGEKHIYYSILEQSEEFGKPRAVIQIVHGMCEHFGRYDEFCAFMSKRGFVVAGDDHLGHGKTALSPEQQGFFAENNGWRYLVRDEKRMTDILKEKYPDIPLIILGHSMGSFITRLYLSWYPEGVSAAIIMGTSGGVPKGAAAAATKLLADAAGGETHLTTSQGIFYNILTRRVPNKETSLDWITRDKQKIETYKNDPLGDFAFTARAYQDLVRLLAEISDSGWAYSVPKHLPLLLISGGEDPIGDYGAGVRRVFSRLRKAKLTNLAIKIYPEARHELINEINREEVYNDLLTWIEKQLKIMQTEDENGEKTLS